MIGPEVNVPDVTEAVIGYRKFDLDKRSQHNYQLVSPHAREPWPTAERTARCNNAITSDTVVLDGIRPRQHSAPAKECGCGIYAYFDLKPVDPQAAKERMSKWMMGGFTAGLLTYSSPTSTAYPQPAEAEVAAAVALTGRIEVHARGMRAQRARILALGAHSGLTRDQMAGLSAIAEQFGVPVIEQSDLPKMAAEFGRPLDPTLRPSLPPAPASTTLPTAHVSTETGLRLPSLPSKWLLWVIAFASVCLAVAAISGAEWLIGSALCLAADASWFGGRWAERKRLTGV